MFSGVLQLSPMDLRCFFWMHCIFVQYGRQLLDCAYTSSFLVVCYASRRTFAYFLVLLYSYLTQLEVRLHEARIKVKSLSFSFFFYSILLSMKAHGYLLVFKLSILHLFISLNSVSGCFLFWCRGTRDTSY